MPARKITAALKTRITLATIRGEGSPEELSITHGVHAEKIEQWVNKFLCAGTAVLGGTTPDKTVPDAYEKNFLAEMVSDFLEPQVDHWRDRAATLGIYKGDDHETAHKQLVEEIQQELRSSSFKDWLLNRVIRDADWDEATLFIEFVGFQSDED